MTSVTALPGLRLADDLPEDERDERRDPDDDRAGELLPGVCPATHRLVSISQTVRPGRFTPKSAKISSNFGMMNT
jgi:hypothetical protein